MGGSTGGAVTITSGGGHTAGYGGVLSLTTGNAGTAGNLAVTAGNSTGSQSTGASVVINPGSGTATSGNIALANLRGNVGIGTTTIPQKLVVDGNIKLTGNILSDGDICIGTCQ